MFDVQLFVLTAASMYLEALQCAFQLPLIDLERNTVSAGMCVLYILL